RAVPRAIGLLGLAAVTGAVTSSFSSSILSAGSMLSWNCLKRLVWPSLSIEQMKRVIRSSIFLFGAIATVLALQVQSGQALWFFTSDLVFVLLFPQLLYALFDRKANRSGSIAAFIVSAVLRVGAGEPLLGLPAFIHYADGVPFRTLAAVTGLVVLPLVSRATARWGTATPLQDAMMPAEATPPWGPAHEPRPGAVCMARPFVHRDGPRVCRGHRRAGRARRRPLVPPRVHADDGGDRDRRDRRLVRPAGERERGAAVLRRPRARRPDRLPHLHVA